MIFNRAMIDLVREIHRHAPSEAKPSIKLSNPDMLYELIPVYEDSNDTILKTLIKELFALAGDHWPQALEKPATSATQAKPARMTTKVYRGQIQLVEAPVSATDDESSQKPSPPKRVYRGQVVEG